MERERSSPVCYDGNHAYKFADGELPPVGTLCDCGEEPLTDEDMVIWLMRDED